MSSRTNYNPYDDVGDDPFCINTTNTTTNFATTSSSSSTTQQQQPKRAFTSSPQQYQNYQFNLGLPSMMMNNNNVDQYYHQSPTINTSSTVSNNLSNNSLVSPTAITSTPTYQTTPRRSTIGFEDDFSSSTTTTPSYHMVDTNFTIESSDFLLSLGSSPSHRHTLSGESTKTLNQSSSTTLGGSGNVMMVNNYSSPQMMPVPSTYFIPPISSGHQNKNSGGNTGAGVSGTFTSPRGTGGSMSGTGGNVVDLIDSFSTPAYWSNNNNTNSGGMLPSSITTTTTTVNNTPRQSVVSPTTPMAENPTIASIKSNSQQEENSIGSGGAVKRRSRTMFESSSSSNAANNTFSKDLLDFTPFSSTNSTSAGSEQQAKAKNKHADHIKNLKLPTKTSTDHHELYASSGERGSNSPQSNNRPKSTNFTKSSTAGVVAESEAALPTSPSTPVNRELLYIGADNKLSIPESILMLSLSDSGIVKSYVSDQIEELCMMGMFCELILHRKITTRPLRSAGVANGGGNECKFGLQVLDSKPLVSNNKRDSSIIELLNEVLSLLHGINEKCAAKDVNQMTIRDYVKILTAGKKVGSVLIYKIANILTRIGKQLSERKIVDYKKTLFLFLSLPIKDRIERDRCLNELILFLKMLRSELGIDGVGGSVGGAGGGVGLDELIGGGVGNLSYDTCTERMLKNRHDFVIYSLLGIFTMNSTDILSNDVIKNENDRKALRELSLSIFNIKSPNSTTTTGKQSDKKRRPSTLIDEAMSEEDEDDELNANMLSVNSVGSGGVISPSSSASSMMMMDKKLNPFSSLHQHFPEGLNYFEEVALQLKRCIYGSNKQ